MTRSIKAFEKAKRVASSDTEAELRQDHVMSLKSRDVTEMTEYRAE
jgi:hypothetical protein